MRILVQDVESRAYFSDASGWTRNHQEAVDFGTSVKALQFALKNPTLGKVRIVLKFNDSQYNIVLDTV
jgi:hypothetical protein